MATVALVCAIAALVVAVPGGSASAPATGGGGAAAEKAAKKKKKKCKKKAKKGAEAAKKKGKKCKKKARTGPPRLRASLIWTAPQFNVDLVTVDAAQNATPPEAIFGTPATRPPPVPDGFWSGDVAGGPETFTDTQIPYDRPLRFYACVNPHPTPLTITVSLFDPGSTSPRVTSVDVPPGGSPAPISLGESPATGTVPEVDFICEQRQI